jgi:hypothetical protein
MRSHFHLVVETPQPNLVAGMKWFLGTYSSRYDRRHQEFGRLFSGRYKALLVDGSGNGCLKAVCDYARLNPVRAKGLRAGRPVESCPWSSYGQYLKPPARRCGWPRVDRRLAPGGKAFQGELPAQMRERRGGHDGPGLRRAVAVHAEKVLPREPRRRGRAEAELERRTEGWGLRPGEEESLKGLRRGWCLGGEEFKQRQLEALNGQAGQHHLGHTRPEVAQAKAQRIIAEELCRLGWQELDLASRRKRDPAKFGIALRLRRETALSVSSGSS